MRKRPMREPGWPAALLATCLIVLAGRAGAASGGGEIRGGGQQAEPAVAGPAPDAGIAEPLVAKLWASGFFRRNEAVRAELANNRYIFIEGEDGAVPKGNRACYSQGRGGQDIIYLRKGLLAHFEIAIDGIIEHPRISRRVLPVLVHEICHDLWTNVLDARERASFCRESDELMEEYRRALTDDERLRFLFLAGEDAGDPRRVQSYSGIDGFLATAPPRPLCGQELFAWLAERLFATRAKIPGPLRKYYTCVLAEVRPAAAETVEIEH